MIGLKIDIIFDLLYNINNKPKMQLRTRTISPPQQYVSQKEHVVMFFDTETTGLIKKDNTKQVPHIIQLSYILYDTNKRKMIERYNKYIKIPDSIHIEPESINVHGITRKILENSDNVFIEEALCAFYHAYMKSSKIVGHNILFDIQMIRTEIERNKDFIKQMGCKNPEWVFQTEYQENNNVKCICTMFNTKNFCDIKVESKRINKDGSKTIYQKYPKLSELYYSIFKEYPNKLHDAFEDVKICMRCYLKLNKTIDFRSQEITPKIVM